MWDLCVLFDVVDIIFSIYIIPCISWFSALFRYWPITVGLSVSCDRNRQRFHSFIYATMKVSLLPDSHGNPANRPPLCIDCVLWRTSQKCTSAHSSCSFFISLSFSFSFFFTFVPGIWNQVLSQIQQVKEQKISVCCTYYQINTSHASLGPVSV